MREARFSAPTRVDLAGGTLDIWPVNLLAPPAMTVNVAIGLRATALVRPAPRFRVVNRARGLDRTGDGPEAFFDHPFTVLAGRLVDFFRPAAPVEVRFRTTAPAGSGLGGSSSLGMAIAGALNRVCDAGWTIGELVRIVMDTEVRILGTSTGAQDQLAAGLGATHAHHWESPAPRSERLPWATDAGDPLKERFALVFTGESHSSADPNGSVLERIFAGEPRALRGIAEIARAAAAMREALRARDWDRARDALDREWAARRQLSPAVTTRTLDRFEASLREAGALAVKACGAGGGGTLLAMCAPDRRPEILAAARAAGGDVLDVGSDPTGLSEDARP